MSDQSEPNTTPTGEPSAPKAKEPPPQWLSQELLKGYSEAIILHGELVYRLRLTGQGKLILHK